VALLDGLATHGGPLNLSSAIPICG
jgi:hypothetical protein